jgi:hypothetical protein
VDQQLLELTLMSFVSGLSRDRHGQSPAHVDRTAFRGAGCARYARNSGGAGTFSVRVLAGSAHMNHEYMR